MAADDTEPDEPAEDDPAEADGARDPESDVVRIGVDTEAAGVESSQVDAEHNTLSVGEASHPDDAGVDPDDDHPDDGDVDHDDHNPDNGDVDDVDDHPDSGGVDDVDDHDDGDDDGVDSLGIGGPGQNADDMDPAERVRPLDATTAAGVPILPLASTGAGRMPVVQHQSPARLRRTWAQRLTIGGVVLAALACFGAGSGLYAAQRVIEDRNVITLDRTGAGANDASFESTADEDRSNDTVDVDAPTEPVETFPQAEPEAKNFLITGADNNSCIEPDSPYAAAFGDRSDFGERSDTIMLWRVNPATSQVAVLSFPRDLWVKIAGRSSEQRINVAYERDNPQRLVDTIYENFFIPVDHYIQVDFCAFKVLVDAVDGVSVPFEFPVTDPNTGLNVDIKEPGCFTFDGDHALAYVRSRKLQYFQDGEWKTDGTSDLGRISRQQDFIRRTVDSLLAAGAFDPAVIRALIQTSDDYVVNDSELSLNKMLQFAGVLKGIDPAQITTYQIEAVDRKIQGNAVLIPRLESDNMQAVLKLFRGEATLADTPEQVFDTTTSGPATTEATTTTTTTEAVTETTLDSPVDLAEDESPTTTIEDVPFETLPVVEAEVNNKGIFPDPNITCS